MTYFVLYNWLVAGQLNPIRVCLYQKILKGINSKEKDSLYCVWTEGILSSFKFGTNEC